ncbi:FAD-dependent tricarballylate dehydrogenase TcuA [Stackebrandtia nassauensis]|uniref:Fumarate reductase/succinate dehydrogenase flavoprotein domain protein n=1 Tax=Stackebrandtia nassauensis (strain DSM 44728 / CIP 108903 / NRRL B-16338 / NBRC 102104 / LLR-40K-21) TaxID=446470 RepID=D3Q8D6_STANL|nr:FAD-dependent tricarballylate dehydrogenase TcuA [Stackebrandtia nassauensis]ADD42510.1 fumarate reductase/succinate dehydrogenase flavoprotein domain protein [Stackebrandtia nassauensis DSM 44728]
MNDSPVDVVVVGGGNAGFSAAHAAAQRGRRVVLLEKGDRDHAGGNSYFTAGATRISHDGLADLLDIVEPDERHERTELPPYPATEYAADLERVTEGNNDPGLTRVLVEESADTVRWLRKLGVRYRLMYERQAYPRADGGFLFWGGLHVGNVDGGVGLITDHTRIADELGTEIRYGHAVSDLIVENGRVTGVTGTHHGQPFTIRAESVVLAAGGFESSATWRAEHLGEGWERAVVRGTPHNTGDLLAAALTIGAARGGDWSTAHSIQWDAWFPDNQSNRELTNRLSRQSYPLGIIVNTDGHRFLDEGADFRNYTYAKYGKRILEQPGGIAFQIFDSRLRPMLRTEEYDMPGIAEVRADTLPELAERLGVDVDAFVDTVTTFNAAIDDTAPFDPTVKDGRRADVTPPKSNWSAPIDTAPYYGYPVTCGITFTFGGLKADTDARVLDHDGQPIPGLYVCGEMLGGLFSQNYPGGTGLAAGMVFGRRAGTQA